MSTPAWTSSSWTRARPPARRAGDSRPAQAGTSASTSWAATSPRTRRRRRSSKTGADGVRWATM
ncbi:hypothetical protein V2I01_00045, partial [Micromonospora sp. BRA006-A]|nr:hypothetical protein [Micromonospora sp. BRA006-A]